MAGSAGIHLAVISEHLAESVLFGLFFAVVAAAQLVLAGWSTTRPVSRAVAGVTVVFNMAVIAVWALSRTTGPPIGAEAGHPEAVLLADGAATALELAAVILACRFLGRPPLAPLWDRTIFERSLRPGHRIVTLMAVTVAGVAFTVVAEPVADHHHVGYDAVHIGGNHADHQLGGEQPR